MTKLGFHAHPVLQLGEMITQCRSMLSASNFDLHFFTVMEALCQTFRSIACWNIMLQLVKVKELDVCGSQVLSNSVTNVLYQKHLSVVMVTLSLQAHHKTTEGL